MVGKICTVCRSCSFIDTELSFFTYPGDPIRRKEWLIAVNRTDLIKKLDDDKIRCNHRICEIHFEPRHVQISRLCKDKKFLTKDAFPTLCIGASNKMHPIYDNFLKPTKPIPIANAQNVVWKKNGTQRNNTTVRQEPPVLSKYNLRPIKQKIIHEENSDEEEDDDDDDYYYGNQFKPTNVVYTKVKRPASPPFYNDASQFCESLLNVTQSTQTAAALKAESQARAENNFSQLCSKYLSSGISQLIDWKESSDKHVNFTLFALNLYYSTNLYNMLSNMLSLPPKNTLKYFLLPKTTRISEDFLNAFKCKINNMSTNERICSFSVGSILLKPSLYYDIKHDRVIGFNDINGIQNIYLAKYAIVLMVQGILEDWQQPIAYAFVSEYDNIPEISIWIDEVLTSLISIGLDIRVFVSDPRSEFLYASESRFVTSEKTHFTINGTDIFYIYDTPQLLKIVKNNLKSCNFHYGSNPQDSNNKDFFEKVGNLCNLLNAKSRFSNSKFKRAFSNKIYQYNFLNHMLQLFKNLKVVRRSDEVDVTENMKFIESFQISIKTVQKLFEQLCFIGVNYLITSRLTHKGLERFFAQVKRTGSKEECTPKQFNKIFVRSFVFNALKKPVSRNSLLNSADAEEYAQQLLDEEIELKDSLSNLPLLIRTTDYRDKMPEKNAFVYICGYCYKKCIQLHNCDKFQTYIRGGMNLEDDTAVLCNKLDRNIQICKTVPPEDFTEYLLLLEFKFKEFFDANTEISSIGQEIFKEFEDSDYGFGMPCPCFPIDYLKALFIRLRLFYTIRKNNRMIKQKKGLKSFRVFNL